MTYLKYSNLCADMVRAALKEPVKAKAKAREIIYFRQSLWKDGVPQKQGEAAWGGRACLDGPAAARCRGRGWCCN